MFRLENTMVVRFNRRYNLVNSPPYKIEQKFFLSRVGRWIIRLNSCRLLAVPVSNIYLQYVNEIIKRPCHPTFIHVIVKDALIISKLAACVILCINLVSTFYSYWSFVGYAERKFGVPSFPCWRLSSGSSRSDLHLFSTFPCRFGTQSWCQRESR